MSVLTRLKDRIQGKAPKGARRSSLWPRVRDTHLGLNPICALCGGKKKLQVHHIHPFHLHPELENNPMNLVTLCEGWGTANCHLFAGHLGNFKSFNVGVQSDAAAWNLKIKERP